MTASVTTPSETHTTHETPLSLTQGGPLFSVQKRLHLTPHGTQALGMRFPLVAITLTWLPVVLIALPARLRTGQWDPLLLRSEVHVRLLVALFLFLMSDALLEQRVRAVTRGIFKGQVLPTENMPALSQRILQLTTIRDARLPELLMLASVYAASLAAFLGLMPSWAPRWLAPAVFQAGIFWTKATPAWWWYLLVSEPFFLFVLLRWLFHWSLWGALLWKLAALSPRTDPSHADRAGGLGFLAAPLYALRFFVAGFALAIAAVWLDEIAVSKAEPKVLANDLAVFIGISAILALLPYMPLTRILIATKQTGVMAYSMLMRRYTERFDSRWLATDAEDASLLGSNDFQALADLGTSFSVVKEMRAIVPGPDEIKAHLVAALAPFLIIPLLHARSTTELIQRLILRFLGG